MYQVDGESLLDGERVNQKRKKRCNQKDGELD